MQEEGSEATGMVEMMKMFLEDRKQREEEMREQMRLLRELVVGATQREEAATTPTRVTVESDSVRLSKLTDGDDIEAYLTTFERTMTAYEVDRARWSFKLAPQLTGKAQQAYAAMPADDAADYSLLKAAILKRYNISEETYRQRLRTTTRTEGETNQELAVRLQDLAQKWMKGCTAPEQFVDLIAMEQLLNTLPPDIRIWVSERKPKTCTAAGQLADDYLQARRSSKERYLPDRGARTGRRQDTREQRHCHTCGQTGHLARECPKGIRSGWSPDRKDRPPRQEKREVICFNCRQKGHISTRCPNNALYCGPKRRYQQEQGVCRPGVVEGQYVDDILLDTGCSKTLVRKNLVPSEKLQEGDAVTIRCAHGDTVLYPIADVEMEVGGRRIQVEAAVSDTLPVSVLLGTDVAELGNLLGGGIVSRPSEHKDRALVVTTRAQASRQEMEEATQRQREGESGVQVHAVTATGPEEKEDAAGVESLNPNQDLGEGPVLGSDFADDIFISTREKIKLTKGQKRAANRQYAGTTTAEPESELSHHALEVTSRELAGMQEADETLTAVRRAAEGRASTAGGGFFKREGLIYRKWTPPGHDEEMAVEQLVLPQQCRPTVLHLAHTIPLAGHLGRDKTSRRILQRFYWPTVYKDVADYCRSCAECQKSCDQKVRRAPLVSLPIIGEPFERIAMDIVGPLPRSRAGNRFILVVCDYATRYPEAIPLRTIDAETIAEELVKLFSRVGIPKEILTDQGSNFVSQLLTEIYRLLHIHPIRTTPYHPQTDGLVERFNKTLKSLLRKAAVDVGKDWDKLLPYLLFAYREVPQASTGFSPFELLYGRAVRGPLDVLREAWQADRRSSESVVSHVLAMREKLARMTDLVRENLTQAQQQQKHWYDRTAREREFQVGDQVLVLLPTDANKLLARWQGPYRVLHRVGTVNYLVDMHDRRKRKRVLHVNMLRKWHTPTATATSYAAEEVEGDGKEDDVLVWKEEEVSDHQPTVGEQLSSDEQRELKELMRRYAGVLQNQPGHTTLAEHHISTGTAHPIRLPPYRIPHAYREAVQKELREMLDSGIIQRSGSEWAAPIVLVKKKDGSLRLCVDYRRLNAVSQTDAYPMPRIDDLIDRLGKAKYITTLDLTRGYWQVPVAEEDQPKTAFATPFGLFQFRVMPFGLSGAPATFQRMMDCLIQGMENFTAAYLDDLVIYSETWEEHLRHIQSVLDKLQEAGLTAKPAKCQFGMAQCTYLGHIVGNGRVYPEADKLQAVKAFPIPVTKKQVRGFLGLTGYYRRFIPDYASIAVPLTDLTKKSAPNQVRWSVECNKAFEKLKSLLCSAPVLQSPDFSQPFVLQTDASDFGVGAVLSQTDGEGIDHPVAYFSRKLLPREQRYSTVEKECLAIKLGTQAFRVYLLGRPFTIQTDHRALQWLDRLKETNSRLTRWSLALQPFQFTVQHRAGKANANADALSRAAA